jgi:hypothetical protein
MRAAPAYQKVLRCAEPVVGPAALSYPGAMMVVVSRLRSLCEPFVVAAPARGQPHQGRKTQPAERASPGHQAAQDRPGPPTGQDTLPPSVQGQFHGQRNQTVRLEPSPLIPISAESA